MSKTDFRPQDVYEPDPDCPSQHGLLLDGECALAIAQTLLMVPARAASVRDQHHVRGLACLLMRWMHGDRYSWRDIAFAVYGRRKHTTAITAAKRVANQTRHHD